MRRNKDQVHLPRLMIQEPDRHNNTPLKDDHALIPTVCENITFRVKRNFAHVTKFKGLDMGR